MPKEIIDNRWMGTFHRSHANCPGVNCLDDCAGEPVPASQSYVAIGWSKEHPDVQIGVVDPLSGGEHDDAQLWLDLDREGLNRLIRSARKARDDAFGKDE